MSCPVLCSFLSFRFPFDFFFCFSKLYDRDRFVLQIKHTILKLKIIYSLLNN